MEDNPAATPRTGRQGHDQNKGRLQRDIDIGLRQVRPIVETIRILNLYNNRNGKLFIDFMKLRDIMAHKGVDDIIFYQMTDAFLMYCKRILNLEPVTNEPKTTNEMSTKFARMADINVVTCANWFFHFSAKDRMTGQDIVREMEKAVKKSSFSQLTFSVDAHNQEVLVTDGVERKRFETWLEEVNIQVKGESATYSPEEIEELKQCYQDVADLL